MGKARWELSSPGIVPARAEGLYFSLLLELFPS